MVNCSSCGKEIDGNYCSSCGERSISNTLKKSTTKKTSNFWYLLPIFLGIIGGVIAYFVLRNSDSRKARNCLLIGIAILILGIVILAAAYSTMTDEQREQFAAEREKEKLQKEVEKREAEEVRKLQEEKALDEKQSSANVIQMEPGVVYNVPVTNQEKTQDKIENTEDKKKLDTEDIQTIITGFESYNKSVKILLDMCGDVESETDFRLLGSLMAESGDSFLENTSNFGAVRNKLMAEGYGENPVLGPLMNESETLVELMSTCMEILAWEFSG